MKRYTWFLAFGLLLAAGLARAADDDDENRPKREDPWKYDEAKQKKRDKEAADDAASERTFANAGQFNVAAERLFGIARTGIRIKLPGGDQTSSVNHANLLLNENADARGYSAPRIAFDYFVIDGLSVGGALGYSGTSGSGATHEFTFAPRFGYALMFGSVVGIWPRAGVTYQDRRAVDARTGVLAATVEVPFVFVPVDHVAVSVGPTLDATLVGKYNPAGPQGRVNYAQDEIGLSAGLVVFF